MLPRIFALDRVGVSTIVGFLVVLTGLGQGCAPQPARRPNIIFIMADDHAAHAISAYGSRINQTPNIDRLADAGMRFNNCFCTNAICAPSRAVILTGQYSHRNHVIDHNRTELNPACPTFPELLRDAGYETALIGKWHLESKPAGFDYWCILPGQGAYRDPVIIEMGTQKKLEGYTTDLITDKCIDWLKGRKGSQPFLLLCHHKAPHRNWQPADRHQQLFADADVPEPATFDDDYATRSAAAREQTMSIAHDLDAVDLKGPPPAGLQGEALKEWKYQRFIKDYLRCITAVDENVGRLLDYLEQSGQAEDTLVVYTSDQGFFLGDHGWFDKRFMYEEALRMPLLVRYPRQVRPGSTSDALVTNLDFAETFLDYASVAPPAGMQGRSLQPVLKGRQPRDWRQSMYYHYYEFGHLGEGGWHKVHPHYGVRTDRYKLIHFYDLDAWELFDLEKDPRELRNVYADPAYQPVVGELKAELARLQALYEDPIPRPGKVARAQGARAGRGGGS